MIGWVKRSPITSYFALVFGIEWLLVLTLSSVTSPIVALLIGSWLPDGVGLLVTGLSAGQAGLHELFGKVILWRVSPKWYTIAIFLPVTMAWISIGLFAILTNNIPAVAPTNQFTTILLGALFTGALGEELGWRGTALPRMQAHWNALVSSLILGILWGLYHLPSFFLSGLPLQNAPLISFLICSLCLTIYISWTFNHTRGSLIIVFLYHFSFNFFGNLLGIFTNPLLFQLLTFIMVIGAIAVVGLDWKRFAHLTTSGDEGFWIIQ
jgi:CAAX protease family protein